MYQRGIAQAAVSQTSGDSEDSAGMTRSSGLSRSLSNLVKYTVNRTRRGRSSRRSAGLRSSSSLRHDEQRAAEHDLTLTVSGAALTAGWLNAMNGALHPSPSLATVSGSTEAAVAESAVGTGDTAQQAEADGVLSSEDQESDTDRPAVAPEPGCGDEVSYVSSSESISGSDSGDRSDGGHDDDDEKEEQNSNGSATFTLGYRQVQHRHVPLSELATSGLSAGGGHILSSDSHASVSMSDTGGSSAPLWSSALDECKMTGGSQIAADRTPALTTGVHALKHGVTPTVSAESVTIDITSQRITRVEEQEVGRVTWDAYLTLFKAAGGWAPFALLMVFFAVVQGSDIWGSWWIGYWGEELTTTRPRSVRLESNCDRCGPSSRLVGNVCSLDAPDIILAFSLVHVLWLWYDRACRRHSSWEYTLYPWPHQPWWCADDQHW